ncbi:MAG: hypothetical protein AAF704_05490 [Cyanobacteria bacterium P01_D01_bin.123]
MKLSKRAIAVALSGLGASVVLVACGSEVSTPTTALPSGTHNAAATRSVDGDRTQLIFEDNSTDEATLGDTALALALLNLGGSAPDDATLIDAANFLIGTQQVQGRISAPTPANADFATDAGQFDLKDIAAILAATRSTAAPPNATALVDAINSLFGRDAIDASGIRAIPGVALPPTGDPTPTPSPTSTPSSPFQNVTSLICDNTRGVEALYWDYSNGEIRADYPATLTQIPYLPGIPFILPQEPLYNFVYPSGWQAHPLVDARTSLTGVDVIRQDRQAQWRRLNFVASGIPTAKTILDSEVSQILAFIGNPQTVETLCTRDLFDPSSQGTSASTLVKAGEFTANVNVQAVPLPPVLGVPSTSVFIQAVLAPMAQYEATAINVFFPITGQLLLGGGNSPDCSDAVDNDSDGFTDFPADDGCSSADDDSEF